MDGLTSLATPPSCDPLDISAVAADPAALELRAARYRDFHHRVCAKLHALLDADALTSPTSIPPTATSSTSIPLPAKRPASVLQDDEQHPRRKQRRAAADVQRRPKPRYLQNSNRDDSKTTEVARPTSTAGNTSEDNARSPDPQPQTLVFAPAAPTKSATAKGSESIMPAMSTQASSIALTYNLDWSWLPAMTPSPPPSPKNPLQSSYPVLSAS